MLIKCIISDSCSDTAERCHTGKSLIWLSTHAYRDYPTVKLLEYINISYHPSFNTLRCMSFSAQQSYTILINFNRAYAPLLPNEIIADHEECQHKESYNKEQGTEQDPDKQENK